VDHSAVLSGGCTSRRGVDPSPPSMLLLPSGSSHPARVLRALRIWVCGGVGGVVQGYLAHEKPRPLRILQ